MLLLNGQRFVEVDGEFASSVRRQISLKAGTPILTDDFRITKVVQSMRFCQGGLRSLQEDHQQGPLASLKVIQ